MSDYTVAGTMPEVRAEDVLRTVLAERDALRERALRAEYDVGAQSEIWKAERDRTRNMEASVTELQDRITALLAVLRQAREALEMLAGRDNRAEMPCAACAQNVRAVGQHADTCFLHGALAAIDALLGRSTT